jgi:hypothetical protein
MDHKLRKVGREELRNRWSHKQRSLRIALESLLHPSVRIGLCKTGTSPPDKDNRLVHQTFEKVSIDYQERHLRLLAH